MTKEQFREIMRLLRMSSSRVIDLKDNFGLSTNDIMPILIINDNIKEEVIQSFLGDDDDIC